MFITPHQIKNDKFQKGNCYNFTFEYEEHRLLFLGLNFADEPPVFDTILNFLHYCEDTEQEELEKSISLYFHYCTEYGEPIDTETYFNLIGKWCDERKCYIFPLIENCSEFEPKKKNILSQLAQGIQ